MSTMIRRWLKPRWSLRTLLVLFICSTVVTGWLARKCYFARQSPVPILGPMTSGMSSDLALSDEEIVRTLRHSDDFEFDSDFTVVQIVKHIVESRINSPRVVPLIGNASLHHQIYRCIVIGNDGSLPRAEIVYIDHNHFHMTDDK